MAEGRGGAAARAGLAALAALAACGALELALAPGARVEGVRLVREGLSPWRAALLGQVQLPAGPGLDAEAFLRGARIALVALGVAGLALVALYRRGVGEALRELVRGPRAAQGGGAPETGSAEAPARSGRLREAALVALLCGGLGAGYLTAGFALHEHKAFRATDVLFENDTPRAIKDMAVPEAKHLRTHVHPIFVMLANPAGRVLARVAGSPERAAIGLNALLGALGVALAHAFFRARGAPVATALLLAAVFGLSASQFVFSAVPSTHALAVCSLLLTYLLLARLAAGRAASLRAWTAAAFLTLGVTATNFLQTLACFVLGERGAQQAPGRSRAIPRALALGLVAGTAVVLASLVQRALYPSASLFFLPSSQGEEVGNASLLLLSQPLTVIVQLAKQFFVVDVVAPVPDAWTYMQRVFPALTTSTTWRFGAFGLGALALWGAALVAGGAAFARSLRSEPRFALPIAACLGFQLVLHALYGMLEKDKLELFEFSGNWTFLVVAVASTHWLRARRGASLAWLAALAALLAANDAYLVVRVLEVYPFGTS